MKYRIKHIRCKNLMLLEAANLNMPSSFIIKTKRPMSKHLLKQMAAKIIRESYGQRMSNCIVEELETDGPRGGVSPSRELLLKRFKLELKQLADLILDYAEDAAEIRQYAKKIGATRVYDAFNSYFEEFEKAFEEAYYIIKVNYGPIDGYEDVYESYSQPKYRYLVEELETDGPRGGVSPSHKLKGKMKDYISHSYGGHQRLSDKIMQLAREKDRKLLLALQHLQELAKKIGNKDVYRAIMNLISAKVFWGKILRTTVDPSQLPNYSTPEQRYMKDRWNRYKLYDKGI
jgi:hypothetical protein